MNELEPLLICAPFLKGFVSRWPAGYRLTTPDELPPGEVRGIRVAVSASQFPLALADRLPDLGLVAAFSTGYEGIDVPALRARGIEVTHAAGVNAHDVADHAMALMLARWNGIVEGDAAVKHGPWQAPPRPRRSLRGLPVGVFGLGRIGTAVATRLSAFGADVAWWGPRPKPDAAWPRAESLLALAERSVILILTAKGDETSMRQVNRPVLDALGPEGLVVNVARGCLIDEDALVQALREGRLGGAALDVFDDEPTPPARWEGVPGCVFTPHTAGRTAEAGQAMDSQLRENVHRYLAGEALLSPVPFD